MYHHTLHQQITERCNSHKLNLGSGDDLAFYTRLVANATAIRSLYDSIYSTHSHGKEGFSALLDTIIHAHINRSTSLRRKDDEKAKTDFWFLSNQIAGMSLYVDRFCGKLSVLPEKLDYLQELGVNFLHLMPVFESPEGESDGGYAVSDFRKVDPRFGTLDDLKTVQAAMQQKGMYLMIDIVLNHTSHHHPWAIEAKKGNKAYQDYYYFYDDRTLPDQFEQTMPEIFPESSPGSFTWVEECRKWVMTVFHHYQWDLNYTNPAVFNAMLDNVLFYANLGVDIIRIDAPAFIWKALGTSCQNLPKAHELLRLIKQCVIVAAPGTALLGEAIVAPKEIMKYFGTDLYTGKECDVAYNATQMALQWDALATGDTRVMLAAQHDLLQKPYGTTWITYTRCHDDIGLGYEDASIVAAGFNAYEHRKFLKEYYSGQREGSPASGALFSVNPKTQDARISGSLASLCGLEKTIESGNANAIQQSLQKIIMMQAHSFFLGGIPMLFYGDECGYTNDYSYLQDPGKSYDNRWMHRPLIDWHKNAKATQAETIEGKIFTATKKLLQIRKQVAVFADRKNIRWLTPHNIHVAGFIRSSAEQTIFCLFNYHDKAAYLTWYAFRENGRSPVELYDHWSGKKIKPGADYEYLVLEPYGIAILEAKY
jgi:amylosucrase